MIVENTVSCSLHDNSLFLRTIGRKIIKIVATGCQSLRLKCTTFDFPQTPYLDLRGLTSKRMKGKGR